MKTWAASVNIICHVNIHVNCHVNNHVNVHVIMAHQHPCHVHDLIYDECCVTFVTFIYVIETDLDWAGQAQT
jgi:hypothetical protein